MSTGLDVAVIGAGVVGLAVGRGLARAGRHVVVLESENRIGSGQSSRNSEVIHAGLYYPPGSLKARACVRGRRLLYEYLSRRDIPHRRTGKLVVAGADEGSSLESLADNARANGVENLSWLDRHQIQRLEPAISADVALLSPDSGIVDSHGLMLALHADLEAAGGTVLTRHTVDRLDPEGPALWTGGARHPCRLIVNCAGLGALALLPADEWCGLPTQRYARGHYFALSGPTPTQRLIYPLPDPHGLGIHLGLNLDGRCRFGPDVEWVDQVDFRFDASRLSRFVAAIQRYWPDVRADRLVPDQVGIRTKIVGPRDAPGDFRMDGPADHGVPGVVNMLGIESPGLTSCLALAEAVTQLVEALEQ